MKNLQKLGIALSKAQQKQINGGGGGNCNHMASCSDDADCGPITCYLACIFNKCLAQ